MDGARRSILRTGALALVAVALDARAQKSALPRIGYLTPGDNPREDAFWRGMRDLGYVEGRTIVVERRSAGGDFARLPALATELVKSRPDVIVAITTSATIALKDATASIPIVTVGANDPVGTGLAQSLSHPGGNVTGTSSQSAASVGKLFDVMRRLVPGARRVASLWDPVNAISQQLRLGETLVAAAKVQLLVRVTEVHGRDELERVFDALASWKPDAILVPGDTFFVSNAARVAELARARRLPLFSPSRRITESGGLASYGADLATMSRRAATYVQRILKGARPAELAIELPTKFELVVNRTTAAALGIALTPGTLTNVDDVVNSAQ